MDFPVVFVVMYVAAAMTIRSGSAFCVLALQLAHFFVFATCVNEMSGHQLHLAYLCLTLIAAGVVNGLPVKIALLASVLFQMVMAWDAYVYPTTQTWLYSCYDANSMLLHALVIASCINWSVRKQWIDRASTGVRNFCWNLRYNFYL